MTGGKSFSLAFYTSKTDIGRAPLENFYQVSQIAQPAKQNCGEITSKCQTMGNKRNVGFITLTFNLLSDGLFIPFHVYLWLEQTIEGVYLMVRAKQDRIKLPQELQELGMPLFSHSSVSLSVLHLSYSYSFKNKRAYSFENVFNTLILICSMLCLVCVLFT